MGIFKKRAQAGQMHTDTGRQRRERITQAEYDMQEASGRVRAARSALFALTGSSYGDGRPPAGASKEYDATVRQLREAEGDYDKAHAQRTKIRNSR